ncbi:hypothetical protein PsorP6_017885 [Peronosclerospora sorghi]|uniref:Uncharacterized protein n=1 Tax=Peronosclerospora sorghi TaxID=230839 RepID=A0ACC0WFC7_9STRA|nr:hypothetical protein PsorP6_017885 [Peronosclerospora sorghi]
MSDEHAGDTPSWMKEQAAEYADLVGSFVESVVDSDTDEILEYQLIWEGGDLGVALTTIESGDGGVAVSRVTGKGFPFGIKNVGPGDLLLSINMKDTTKMNLDDVVAYLQVCDLPATLRFKKLSPVTNNEPVTRPRKSTYTITSGSSKGPTSPIGSTAPPSLPRSSNKYARPSTVHPDLSSLPKTETPAPSQRQSDKMPTPSQRTSEPAESKVDTSYQRVSKPEAAFAPMDSLRKLDGLVLTSGENDLGLDDSEDESPRESQESRDSWRGGSFDVDAIHSGLKDDEEEKEDVQLKEKQQDNDQFQRGKSASTAAVPGHFPIETEGNVVKIVQDAEDASSVAAADKVRAFSPAESTNSLASSMNSLINSSINDADGPRPSVPVTMDSTAPIKKSQPIGTLHEMCAKGNLRGVLQYLRVNGPEDLLNREPNHGQTGLHLAVKSGKVPLVKVIVEQYKPLDEIINLEDDKGNTALHFAATKSPAMVHLLLENGASANVKNSRKFTPLIISVITSKDDSVIIPRMLLKFGANPNDMHDSQTVIHTAISTGRLNIAGALVRAGAKMDVEDAEGKSVFEKLPRKDLRLLISHIYFPPTHITRKERSECMLCHHKFKFGFREHNCTHCGRLCCAECSALHVEMYKFPMGFPGRTRRGAANRDQKRVCKTCYNVFKERNDEPEKSELSKFINRVINIEWDEVNPDKLQKEQEAGRRGE